MKKTAAVIVTYNRKELLKECIGHLKTQSTPLDIIVVDNASTDDTAQLFAEKCEGIIYFNTGSNLGGSGGFSYGIKKGTELGYDYLWILDDDTMPTDTALEKLLVRAEKLNDDFGFLSSKVLWKDDTICDMNVQKISKWKRLKVFDHTVKVQYASFVSLLVKCDVVRELGLPYKEFFIWADDWEYTRRISKKFSSYFVPESIVHHFCNSNVGADIVNTAPDRMDRFKYMYRNDVVMYRQDGLEGYFYLFIRNILHIFRIITKADHKNEKIRLLFSATKEGRKFRPEIEFPGQA